MLDRRQGGRTSRPLIFSAEAISCDRKAMKKAVQGLADYIRDRSEDMRIIACVRPPRFFISSMFQ